MLGGRFALHIDVRSVREEGPDTHVSGLLVARFVVASHEENARHVRVPARTPARRCQPARRGKPASSRVPPRPRSNQCAAPDFRPSRTSPDDFSARGAGLHAAIARCVGPYLSSLPRFLDCRALPTRPGSAVPTFSHELLRWICRRAMDTEVSPEGPPLPRVGGTRFQSSPVLPGSVITLSD